MWLLKELTAGLVSSELAASKRRAEYPIHVSAEPPAAAADSLLNGEDTWRDRFPSLVAAAALRA
jgi:hypothetical protein